jgi:hypothetical protein
MLQRLPVPIHPTKRRRTWNAHLNPTLHKVSRNSKTVSALHLGHCQVTKRELHPVHVHHQFEWGISHEWSRFHPPLTMTLTEGWDSDFLFQDNPPSPIQKKQELTSPSICPLQIPGEKMTIHLRCLLYESLSRICFVLVNYKYIYCNTRSCW